MDVCSYNFSQVILIAYLSLAFVGLAETETFILASVSLAPLVLAWVLSKSTADWIRTSYILIRSQMLYPLSYND